jgi:hypothetical protein
MRMRHGATTLGTPHRTSWTPRVKGKKNEKTADPLLLFALAREQYEAVIRLKNPSKTPFPNNDLPRARLKLHGRIFRPSTEVTGVTAAPSVSPSLRNNGYWLYRLPGVANPHRSNQVAVHVHTSTTNNTTPHITQESSHAAHGSAFCPGRGLLGLWQARVRTRSGSTPAFGHVPPLACHGHRHTPCMSQ